MSSDQRKRTLTTIFEYLVVGLDRVSELSTVEGWRPFMKATVTSPRTLPGGGPRN